MKLSACLIVKNDAARLTRAVASIRPYVDEVVIVDTGSTDGTAEAAFILADKFEQFTACNFPDGEIADFSAARNRSLELASHNCVLWLDSDDEVDGAEHIAEAVEWAVAQANGQPWRVLFGYDYDQDADGRSVNWQRRERIVYPKERFHWVYRVHEGLTCKQATEWKTLEAPQPIVWRHHIDRSKPRSQRNLRILRDHVKQFGVDAVDAKTAFDLGMEFAKAGDHVKALGWLGKFIAMSDLDDEKLLACMHAVDVLSFWPGREQEAAIWAARAVDIRPDWPDGYWAMAKLAYTSANRARGTAAERRHLERALHFAHLGLERAEPNTSAPRNPADRGYGIPAILFDAEERLGHHQAATSWLRQVAHARPDDNAIALRLRDAELKADPNRFPRDIVVSCGLTQEPWDPKTAEKFGIGGSETAVIEVAKRLAAQGDRVRVYCYTNHPGLYDDVEYRNFGDADAADGCDLLIAWRNASLLETVRAKCKWLWVHDTQALSASPWNVSLADRVLALSDWHAKNLADKHPTARGRISVTSNGIDLTRFVEAVERNPRKAIYSSSPDRGLDQLLEMWPRIRERVPDAELHIFYGFSPLHPREYVDEVTAKMAVLSEQGVVYRGRVDQKTLAREMLSAGAWLHPSWAGAEAFDETSCIGAMEAQAAGLRIVCGWSGALPETARHGVLIRGDMRELLVQGHFIDATVVALTADASLWRPVSQDYAHERFSWNAVAAQWREWIASDLEASIAAPTMTAARPDARPRLHMVLAPAASGDVVMDAANDPGGEAQGGGSRVGFLGLVRAMAKLGRYHVRAFSTFKDALVARDGVEYIRLDQLRSYEHPDVALAYYDTSPLVAFGPSVLRIASHHTYAPYMHFDHADINTAPSRHALEFLKARFDPTGHWAVLPNAVGEMPIERRPVPGRILYHTSPDRGLHHLLAALPDIRRAVPHATLHVVGGVQEILDAEPLKGRAGDRMRQIQDAYRTAEATGGIVLRGRLSRSDLWHELAEASVFAFPCDPVAPCETFSISVMECLKIGLPVVLRPTDALESIYAGHVRMASLTDFSSHVVDVLTNEAEREHLATAGQALAARFTFERAALVLDGIIREHGRSGQVERSDGEALAAYL